MDGDRLGTSRGPREAAGGSVRLAPSRWTTCDEPVFRTGGRGVQVAHTAHSADYYGQRGATNNRTTDYESTTTTTTSGEV